MIIAIASGKGGTGKTTLAVNLARAFDADIQLLDCDVEEPNAHLFLPAEPAIQGGVKVVARCREDDFHLVLLSFLRRAHARDSAEAPDSSSERRFLIASSSEARASAWCLRACFSSSGSGFAYGVA